MLMPLLEPESAGPIVSVIGTTAVPVLLLLVCGAGREVALLAGVGGLMALLVVS
ncbi:MAG: hypothetical protein AAF675_01625 [Pseudomonadota bacterium]